MMITDARLTEHDIFSRAVFIGKIRHGYAAYVLKNITGHENN